MNIGIIIDVMTSWQVLVIIFVLLLFFPIVFFVASLDKKPVRIDRVASKPIKNPEAGKKGQDDGDGRQAAQSDE